MIDLFGNDTQPATRMREGKYDMHKRRNKYRKATVQKNAKHADTLSFANLQRDTTNASKWDYQGANPATSE